MTCGLTWAKIGVSGVLRAQRTMGEWSEDQRGSPESLTGCMAAFGHQNFGSK